MKDAYSVRPRLRGGERTPTTACSCAYLQDLHAHGPEGDPDAADTGPIGGDLSHKFIILAETGESRGVLPQGLP